VHGAVRILIEAPETDKVVVPEQFNLFTSFLHLDVFHGQRVDREDLRICLSSEN
jgi:hypothetical protein